MSNSEMVTMFIAVLALIVSVFSVVFDYRNNQIQTELEISKNMTEARKELQDLLKIDPKTEEYKRTAPVVIEGYLTVIEDVCYAYLKRRVNREVFKSKYKKDLKTICNSSIFKETLHEYTKIIITYDKLN